MMRHAVLFEVPISIKLFVEGGWSIIDSVAMGTLGKYVLHAIDGMRCPLHIPQMLRRVRGLFGTFFYIAEVVGDFCRLFDLSQATKAIGEHVDRRFCCDRGRRSSEVLAFFVRGFVIPLDRAIDDGLGDPFCILAGSVADGVGGGSQWGEGS